jgi:hypothetical protein
VLKKVELKSLEGINWLANCGHPLPDFLLPCVAVSSWTEADRLCAEDAWENVGIAARGDLTEYLTKKCPAQYQGVWNQKVKELRPKMEEVIVQKLRGAQSVHGFSDAVIECVKWDVLHALMASSYVDFKPPLFYLRLFEIYEKGHFPCGLLGDRLPDGSLQVF